MEENKKNIGSQTESQQEDKALKHSFLSKAMEGFSIEIFVKNIPFMLFVAALGAIYITNNSKAADLVREIEKKKKELKELKWEYMDVHSRLVQATSESQLLKYAGNTDLQPLEKPAFEIKNTIEIKEEN